jgi:hypothetical protein
VRTNEGENIMGLSYDNVYHSDICHTVAMDIWMGLGYRRGVTIHVVSTGTAESVPSK